MTTRVLPPGYRRVRMLKAVEYARETLGVGTLAVLDTDTATRLIKSKHAVAVEPDPPRAMIATTCPKCGSAMEYPEEPKVHEAWTQCQNPACGFGWLR